MEMESEREVVVWLAGLVSTDGTVRNSNKSRGLAFCIYSAEMEWLEIIKKQLENIGINCLIKHYKSSHHTRFGTNVGWIWLHNPRKIALLFDKYNVEKYFNPRKWKIVAKAIPYYKSTANRSRYTYQDDCIIKNNLYLPNQEIANLLENRT